MLGEEKTEDASELQVVEAQIAAASERAKKLQAEVAGLVAKLSLAKGTEEVTQEARVAVEKIARPTLATRIEQALRVRPMTLDELARSIGEPAGRVQTALKGSRTTGKVHNVGTNDWPRWFWKVGAAADSKILRGAVLALLQDKPMTHAELRAATGATDSEVQGALVDIRRGPLQILDLGTPTRKRYFIVRDGAPDARLAPKRKKP